ncbi:MAG: hypothetical protein COV48_06995 [Elusimicrobia bacterium CG11_big_fil_rev_8_21_14_0_20_64_6]|nr:MAG: hypothetical protein COV48_06995 [Elusimicrobia bacterium CG11_big_fil_rev_8_21_14_0_20_64_6]
MSPRKWAVRWIIVSAIGVGGSYSWTSYAAPLEDAQPAAGVIVTKAKDLAKVQAERPKGAPETEAGIQASGDQVSAMLSSCSDQARHSFLESLVLVDGKFAGAHVGTIQECLGEVGYTKFRDLFGPQTPTTKDNAKHWCASRATCRKNDAICTSNCRSDLAQKGGEDVGYISFRDMLQNCSAVERNSFLDSLNWKDGRISGANLKGVAGCGSKLNRLQAAIN